MILFPLYRWDCYKSISSMHRTGHTFSSDLFRTRQDAHAQTKSRWIVSCGKGPTSCTGLSQHSWNHSNSQGLYFL